MINLVMLMMLKEKLIFVSYQHAKTKYFNQTKNGEMILNVYIIPIIYYTYKYLRVNLAAFTSWMGHAFRSFFSSNFLWFSSIYIGIFIEINNIILYSKLENSSIYQYGIIIIILNCISIL